MNASTSPVGLAASAILISFMGLYRQLHGEPNYAKPVRIWRRFAAFIVDLGALGAALIPIATLPVLLGEANATGSFNWSFNRYATRTTDGMLMWPSIVASEAALFAYFYVHAKIGRRTFGQYVLGYRLEGDPTRPKKPAFALNIFLGLLGLFAWPVSLLLAAARYDRAFWWNLRSGTRLVLLE